MTIELLDPNDTGEIPRLPGEDRTVILRRDTGEATQRIDPRLIQAPSFDAIPRPVIDITDTVVYHQSFTVGIVPDLVAAQPIAPRERVFDIANPSGPSTPPPLDPGPVIPPRVSDAETEVVTLLGSLGADLPEPEPEPDEDGDDVVFRRGCNGGQPFPIAAIVHREPATLRSRWRRGRHARPQTFAKGVLIGAGTVATVLLGLDLAALLVMGLPR